MEMIRESLRLRHEKGLSQRDVAASLGISHSTVCRTLQRAEAAGLSWQQVADMADSALHAALHPASDPGVSDGRLEPDWDQFDRELSRKRKRREVKMTRRQLWLEYCQDAVAQGMDAYGYSQFCHLLSQGSAGQVPKVAMRFEYEPGVWGMADFSGKVLRLRLPDGGEKEVEIFVACLCYSRLIYAEALPDQSARSWCMAHRRAFEYFGGTPQRHRVDNLKSGVNRPGREDFVLNVNFRDCTCHYCVAVLPGRPGHARDKGMMEGAVGTVQTVILLPLRDVPFFSIDAMNRAIWVGLDGLNDQPMQGWGVSRRALFEAQERAALQPLPPRPWEWSVWLNTRKVGPDCHIRVERNSYSVPLVWMGCSVEVRRSERMIEVFASHGGERVAVHPIASGVNKFVTDVGHMQEWQKEMQASKGANYGDWLLAETRKIGRHAEAWAHRCIASRDFPPQAFNTLRGMIKLAREHGAERVDEACAEALARERLASGFLRDWLLRGSRSRQAADGQPETIPDHRHVRGADYYRQAGRSTGGGSRP